MDEILVSPVPTVIPSTADYSAVVEKLDTLINLNLSIYAWLAFFITIILCGLVVYFYLRPLWFFLR